MREGCERAMRLPVFTGNGVVFHFVCQYLEQSPHLVRDPFLFAQINSSCCFRNGGSCERSVKPGPKTGMSLKRSGFRVFSSKPNRTSGFDPRLDVEATDIYDHCR